MTQENLNEKENQTPEQPNKQPTVQPNEQPKQETSQKAKHTLKISDLVERESSFDIDEFIGKQVPIEKQNIEFGQNGFYLKVETATVKEVPKMTAGESTSTGLIQIRGSRLFGLVQFKDGAVGYTNKSKIKNFMMLHKVNSIEELIGVPVVLVKRLSKTGTEFLSFE